jgi:hypothetical protein
VIDALLLVRTPPVVFACYISEHAADTITTITTTTTFTTINVQNVAIVSGGCLNSHRKLSQHYIRKSSIDRINLKDKLSSTTTGKLHFSYHTSTTMSATSPIVLILGSGPNVGQHVARVFSAKGYKVALASRSAKEDKSTSQQLNIASDFSDPNSIPAIFEKVKTSLGLPSVVVYNGTPTKSPTAQGIG